MSIASATGLLASYCIELAESYGPDKEVVASIVKSAVNIQTANDLLTLTPATATALRGEAVMNARVPKEAKRSASITPYEKAMASSHTPASFHAEVEEENLPCVGDLLQLTRKGVLRSKHVSVYNAYQVTLKVKSRLVGGAFSKNNICTVYEVIHDSSTCTWPFRKERENMELHFGSKLLKVYRSSSVETKLINRNGSLEFRIICSAEAELRRQKTHKNFFRISNSFFERYKLLLPLSNP